VREMGEKVEEYNLKKLDAMDFEKLCKDIMNDYLKLESEYFYRAKEGKDGGIDLINNSRNIIVQCKRYIKSNYSNLKFNISNELKKVCKYDLKKYYLITTLELSHSERIELNDLLSELNCDIQIIDGIELQDILNDNSDIVGKNYKLWVTPYLIKYISSNDIVKFETDVLIDEVSEKLYNFVETENYLQAKNILENNNVILVTGQPGVGKSTLCNNLVVNLLKEGYNIKYSSVPNVEEIIKSIDFNSKDKELIYMDDFLGKIYLNLRNSNVTDLITKLISKIRKYPEKKLILNSRITILNEAETLDYKFEEYMEKIKKITINLDKMKNDEKGMLLYKHLYYNDISIENIKYLIQFKRYKYIIENRNFNPRLIEQSIKNNKNNGPEEFYTNLINNLNNPEFIWKDEYENRLQEEDRILLNIIITFQINSVEKEIIRELFYSYVNTLTNIDVTKNIFDKSIERLRESLIKIYYDTKTNTISIGTINPSVDDFLENYLNESACDKLIKTSIYIEQIYNILKIKNNTDNINELNLFNYKILNKEDLDSNMLYIISEYNIKNVIYEIYIKDCIKKYNRKNMRKNNFFMFHSYVRAIKKIINNEEQRRFYHIDIVENIEYLIDIFGEGVYDLENLLSLFLIGINDVDNETKKIYLEKLTQKEFEIQNCIENTIIDYYDELDKMYSFYDKYTAKEEIKEEIEKTINKELYMELGLNIEADEDYIYSILIERYNEYISEEKEDDSYGEDQIKFSLEINLEELFDINNFIK
jgi:nucleoside-triphosphatase THEP1